MRPFAGALWKWHQFSLQTAGSQTGVDSGAGRLQDTDPQGLQHLMAVKNSRATAGPAFSPLFALKTAPRRDYFLPKRRGRKSKRACGVSLLGVTTTWAGVCGGEGGGGAGNQHSNRSQEFWARHWTVGGSR